MADKNDISNSILDYLRNRHTGNQNAVSSTEIENIFNIGGAALRECVNKLRCDGQPVCSDINGYYYAGSVSEINRTIRQLNGRIKRINAAAQGLASSRNIFQDSN
jgi:biotin operon repressor